MIEINLIPDVKQELLKAQRTRAIVISASIFASIVAAGIVVLLLGYIFGVQGFRSIYLDDQIDKKGTEFSNIQDLSKVLTIQNQLKTISELNGQKNMDSRIFDMIAAITPQGDSTVSFSQITAGAAGDETVTPVEGATQTGGQIHLEGQTTGYDAMEVFKKTVENTVFEYTVDGETKTAALATNINTGDISYGEDADGNKVLRFTIGFDYPAELLSPKSSNISFKLNIDGNVTDSYLGIPRFAERAKDLQGEQ
jgi:hypothetical protein